MPWDKKGKSFGPIFAVLPRKTHILLLIDLCFCLLIVFRSMQRVDHGRGDFVIVIVFIFYFFCFPVGARCSETSQNTTPLGNGQREVCLQFFVVVVVSNFVFFSVLVIARPHCTLHWWATDGRREGQCSLLLLLFLFFLFLCLFSW